MDIKKKHVLIVEDSPDLQLLLSHVFTSEGYTCTQSYNGQEALNALNSMNVRPDLIVLDLMMPIMGGLEFRNIQLSKTELSDIPVVVLTADANPGERSHQFPGAIVVRKPIEDIETFLKICSNIQL